VCVCLFVCVYVCCRCWCSSFSTKRSSIGYNFVFLVFFVFCSEMFSLLSCQKKNKKKLRMAQILKRSLHSDGILKRSLHSDVVGTFLTDGSFKRLF
jgi:hypothetical protein